MTETRHTVVARVVPRFGSGALFGLDLPALSPSERAQLALLCAQAKAKALSIGRVEEARRLTEDMQLLGVTP